MINLINSIQSKLGTKGELISLDKLVPDNTIVYKNKCNACQFVYDSTNPKREGSKGSFSMDYFVFDFDHTMLSNNTNELSDKLSLCIKDAEKKGKVDELRLAVHNNRMFHGQWKSRLNDAFFNSLPKGSQLWETFSGNFKIVVKLPKTINSIDNHLDKTNAVLRLKIASMLISMLKNIGIQVKLSDDEKNDINYFVSTTLDESSFVNSQLQYVPVSIIKCGSNDNFFSDAEKYERVAFAHKVEKNEFHVQTAKQVSLGLKTKGEFTDNKNLHKTEVVSGELLDLGDKGCIINGMSGNKLRLQIASLLKRLVNDKEITAQQAYDFCYMTNRPIEIINNLNCADASCFVAKDIVSLVFNKLQINIVAKGYESNIKFGNMKKLIVNGFLSECEEFMNLLKDDKNYLIKSGCGKGKTHAIRKLLEENDETLVISCENVLMQDFGKNQIKGRMAVSQLDVRGDLSTGAVVSLESIIYAQSLEPLKKFKRIIIDESHLLEQSANFRNIQKSVDNLLSLNVPIKAITATPECETKEGHWYDSFEKISIMSDNYESKNKFNLTMTQAVFHGTYENFRIEAVTKLAQTFPNDYIVVVMNNVDPIKRGEEITAIRKAFPDNKVGIFSAPNFKEGRKKKNIANPNLLDCINMDKNNTLTNRISYATTSLATGLNIKMPGATIRFVVFQDTDKFTPATLYQLGSRDRLNEKHVYLFFRNFESFNLESYKSSKVKMAEQKIETNNQVKNINDYIYCLKEYCNVSTAKEYFACANNITEFKLKNVEHLKDEQRQFYMYTGINRKEYVIGYVDDMEKKTYANPILFDFVNKCYEGRNLEPLRKCTNPSFIQEKAYDIYKGLRNVSNSCKELGMPIDNIKTQNDIDILLKGLEYSLYTSIDKRYKSGSLFESVALKDACSNFVSGKRDVSSYECISGAKYFEKRKTIAVGDFRRVLAALMADKRKANCSTFISDIVSGIRLIEDVKKNAEALIACKGCEVGAILKYASDEYNNANIDDMNLSLRKGHKSTENNEPAFIELNDKLINLDVYSLPIPTFNREYINLTSSIIKECIKREVA